jgi:3'-5' exonuclease
VARGKAASSSRLYLVLDLETVTDPALTDLEKDKSGKERFPPPPAQEIVCVGFAFVQDLRVLEWGVLDDDEETQLRRLTASIATADPCLVTMNGRHFDLPVVVARCLARGVAFPWYYATRAPRYRYSHESHLDLMDLLCDYGAGPKASLDAWARLVGWPGKQGSDGSSVPALLASGGVLAVADYCMRDVAQTVAVFLRSELLRGHVSLEIYRLAAQALLDKAELDLRTAALVSDVDRRRWLCADEDKEVEAAE